MSAGLNAALRAAGSGALCALPLAAFLAARYLRLRGGMDGTAQRAYLTRAAALAGSTAVAAALFAAAGDKLALPALPAAALGIAALALARGAFKKS